MWPDGKVKTLSITWPGFEEARAKADIEAAKKLDAAALATIVAETVADTVPRSVRRAKLVFRVVGKSLRVGIDVGGNYSAADGTRPFGYFVDLVEPEANIESAENSQATHATQTVSPAEGIDTADTSTAAG